MNHKQEPARYEYKMTSDSGSLQEVLNLVSQHSAMFSRPYPVRVVNNVYFDTPGLKAYFDHTCGAANREKTRVRWYGEPEHEVAKPILERKIKFGQVGCKWTEELDVLKLDKDGPWPIPGTSFSSNVGSSEVAHWRLKTVQPVLALRYVRHYFESADGKYRITVDTDLKYVGLSSKGKPERISVTTAPIIIELKYSPEHATDASVITNELPFRISQFSKYIYALEGLKGVAQ